MKYRKKPIVIEAIEFNETTIDECTSFCGSYLINKRALSPMREEGYYIRTLEGTMTVSVGDYIIKGVNGEFYPCKPDIFWKTYESVDDVNG